MARELIETIRGVGTLCLSDQNDVAVTYEINFYQEFVDAGKGERLKGFKDADGQLSRTDGGDFFHYVVQNSVLRMEDGREMELMVSEIGGAVASAKIV